MARYPLTYAQIVDIQTRRKGDDDVRALLWEIKRQHDIIMRADDLRKTIDQAWKQETQSSLAALHIIRSLLQPELHRFPKQE